MASVFCIKETAMQIGEIIEEVDKLKPNHYDNYIKIKWLSELDHMFKREVIDTHEGGEDISFSGYDANTPLTEVLIVPEPYSQVYRWYLEAQIDLANGELEKYNNSIIMYNNAVNSYQNWYNRTVMPKQTNVRFYRPVRSDA